MQRHARGIAAAALLAMAGTPAAAGEAPRSATLDELSWTESRVPVAHLWGDTEAGPYAKLVKFPPGLVSPPHYHTNDYAAVVITGALLDPTDLSETARPLGPGAHYFLPGGTVYVVRCVSTDPCLIYAHQSGGYDFNRVE